MARLVLILFVVAVGLLAVGFGSGAAMDAPTPTPDRAETILIRQVDDAIRLDGPCDQGDAAYRQSQIRALETLRQGQALSLDRLEWIFEQGAHLLPGDVSLYAGADGAVLVALLDQACQPGWRERDFWLYEIEPGGQAVPVRLEGEAQPVAGPQAAQWAGDRWVVLAHAGFPPLEYSLWHIQAGELSVVQRFKPRGLVVCDDQALSVPDDHRQLTVSLGHCLSFDQPCTFRAPYQLYDSHQRADLLFEWAGTTYALSSDSRTYEDLKLVIPGETPSADTRLLFTANDWQTYCVE